VLRVSLGFQTLENNKSSRPTASSFQMFSRVWKPNETLILVFEIVHEIQKSSYTRNLKNIVKSCV
jgi:hypothetical protein